MDGTAEIRTGAFRQRKTVRGIGMVVLSEEHPLIKNWEEGGAFHLDVRELLEEGGEPYAYIMDCLHQLAPREMLAVHALFEPKPLMTQVRRLGYLAGARRESADHWVVEIQAPG